MSEPRHSRGGVCDLLRGAGWDSRLAGLKADRARMEECERHLAQVLEAGRQVYGVTQGFGPLVRFTADASPEAQGLGLISHLAAGQGEPLPPDVTRFTVWLRLHSMKQGYSAVSPDFWLRLVDLWNSGFTPVVPRDGSLSASGDLIPLAHAALAFAGQGEAWRRSEGGTWVRRPAREVLADLGKEPCDWEAREALAFVNGTSAALAVACFNHLAILGIARAATALTGRIAHLLRANPEAYSPLVGRARGQEGQILAAEWIRAELSGRRHRSGERPLQEPYSLRCAPQVIGAVIDQLRAQEEFLVREALGCTDNPIIYDGEVLHAGNFHAIPVGLCSDMHALCLHQLAFLAERQLALLVDPAQNGGKPPMLTPRPGPSSGLAGVQMAATSFVAKIRQLAHPATLTAVPSNLNNQDHVPMALNGANAVSDMVRLAWLIVGSLAVAIAQWTHIDGAGARRGSVWVELQSVSPPLDRDRPCAAEVRRAATLMAAASEGWIGAPTESVRPEFQVHAGCVQPITSEKDGGE